MFGACGVSLCILAANLLSERRLANILLFHGSAFHFVEFSRTVNRFGLTFPRLRIVGLLFKIHIPKTLLKILIQEIKMNYECFFLPCGAACGVLLPLPGREPPPAYSGSSESQGSPRIGVFTRNLRGFSNLASLEHSRFCSNSVFQLELNRRIRTLARLRPPSYLQSFGMNWR